MSIDEAIQQIFTNLIDSDPAFADFYESNKNKSTEEIEAEYDV